MAIEIILTCPLGSCCEKIKDNKLHRCMWYTCLKGKDPQSDETIDEWRCAMSWMPIMMVENAQMSRGVNDAVCSLREETIKRQDAALIAMIHRKPDAKVITTETSG